MSETTFAWLIERGSEYGYAVPVYWAEFKWTTEARGAMRFATREEAQRLVDRAARTATGLPWGEVVEHGFVEFVGP